METKFSNIVLLDFDMFRIMFSFRAKDGLFISEKDCVEASLWLYDGFRSKGYAYFKSQEQVIKPMVQLTAGAHCNLENIDVSNKKWIDQFKHANGIGLNEMTPTKSLRIAPNFVKIEYIVKGEDLKEHVLNLGI